MAWTPRTTNSGLAPGGAANQYYWVYPTNPGATYNLCLANCTTMTYGRVLENGQSPPVNYFGDAGNWHNYVANGWTAQPYSSYHSSIKPGDIIEWPGHVAVVEAVSGGTAYCSSSLYTGDHGRAQWPVGSGIWDTRTPSIMGSTFSEMWNWFYNNGYGWRVYEYVSETVITNTRMGVSPTYILVNPETPGPGPTPTTTLTIDIVPESYNVTMASSADYVDFPFNVTIRGIPAGESVSGGNTYPGLTRVGNTGWIYVDYTVGGVTYRQASKDQTLRYTRESNGAYSTTKYMYYNITKSTGTISTTTPMYITVKAKLNIPALIRARRRKRGRYNVNIHL